MADKKSIEDCPHKSCPNRKHCTDAGGNIRALCPGRLYELGLVKKIDCHDCQIFNVCAKDFTFNISKYKKYQWKKWNFKLSGYLCTPVEQFTDDFKKCTETIPYIPVSTMVLRKDFLNSPRPSDRLVDAKQLLNQNDYGEDDIYHPADFSEQNEVSDVERLWREEVYRYIYKPPKRGIPIDHLPPARPWYTWLTIRDQRRIAYLLFHKKITPKEIAWIIPYRMGTDETD